MLFRVSRRRQGGSPMKARGSVASVIVWIPLELLTVYGGTVQLCSGISTCARTTVEASKARNTKHESFFIQRPPKKLKTNSENRDCRSLSCRLLSRKIRTNGCRCASRGAARDRELRSVRAALDTSRVGCALE